MNGRTHKVLFLLAAAAGLTASEARAGIYVSGGYAYSPYVAPAPVVVHRPIYVSSPVLVTRRVYVEPAPVVVYRSYTPVVYTRPVYARRVYYHHPRRFGFRFGFGFHYRH